VTVGGVVDPRGRGGVVPPAAIQRGPNGPFVYVLKDGNSVTVRRVTLTQQNDVQAVIATGLEAAGERVVTTGFARLTEGTQGTVSSAEGAGQGKPEGRPRPGGTRGTRGGERGGGEARRSPSAGLTPVANP